MKKVKTVVYLIHYILIDIYIYICVLEMVFYIIFFWECGIP